MLWPRRSERATPPARKRRRPRRSRAGRNIVWSRRRGRLRFQFALLPLRSKHAASSDRASSLGRQKKKKRSREKYRMRVRAFFSHQTVLAVDRHLAHPVSVPILTSREARSQKHDPINENKSTKQNRQEIGIPSFLVISVTPELHSCSDFVPPEKGITVLTEVKKQKPYRRTRDRGTIRSLQRSTWIFLFYSSEASF